MSLPSFDSLEIKCLMKLRFFHSPKGIVEHSRNFYLSVTGDLSVASQSHIYSSSPPLKNSFGSSSCIPSFKANLLASVFSSTSNLDGCESQFSHGEAIIVSICTFDCLPKALHICLQYQSRHQLQILIQRHF